MVNGQRRVRVLCITGEAKQEEKRWLGTSIPKMWVMDPILLCKILEEIRGRGREGFLQEVKRKRRYSELLSDTAQAGKL